MITYLDCTATNILIDNNCNIVKYQLSMCNIVTLIHVSINI